MSTSVDYETPPAIDLLYQLVLMSHVSPALFVLSAATTIKTIVMNVIHLANCPDCQQAPSSL